MDMMLMVIIAMCVTFPFAFYGIIVATQKIIEMFKVKGGWVKARIVMPNARELYKLVKPMGKGVILKIFGKERTYAFDSKKMTFAGNTPMQTWNVDEITPIDLTNPKMKNAISSDELSNIVIRAFNLGVISSMSKEKMLTMLSFLILGAVGILIVITFINGQHLNGVPEALTAIKTQLSSAAMYQATVLT